ncbi:MAG: YciI family protein, partial [Bacteroidota bacterium]|nr:YciI family protein [Bacteroidota bacterium]
LARESHERGELMLAGAFSDPPNQAVLVFHVADKSMIENFVRNDPYVKNGLVQRWEIREWNVVVGQELFAKKESSSR